MSYTLSKIIYKADCADHKIAVCKMSAQKDDASLPGSITAMTESCQLLMFSTVPLTRLAVLFKLSPDID